MCSTSDPRLRPGLGTFVAVRAEGADTATAQRAIESAYASFAMVDRLMHPTRQGSDLVAIRAVALEKGLHVHPWTWQVLALSQRLNELSNGLFDPCLPSQVGRMTDIDLPEPGVVVCRATVAIDLGGIAKGFAVDQAVAALIADGCSAGEVNAGGDLRVFGPDDQLIWLRTSGTAWPMTLRNQACAVSDPKRSGKPSEHCGYYHRSNESLVVGSGVAIVVAETAAVADALTKCVLLSDGANEQGRVQEMLRVLSARSVVPE